MKQILFLLLISFSLSAQIKGVVKDSVSGKPIAYAGAFSNKSNLNFSTDENGKFKQEEFVKTDTLWFFTTGYEIKKILVKDLKKKILLKPLKANEPNNILKTKSASKIWFDLITKKDSLEGVSSTSTNLKAYYLNGIESKNNITLIESIEVNALNFPDKKAVFKMRFFKADSLQNIGKELQNKATIVYVDGSILTNIVYQSNPMKEKIMTAKLTNENTIIKNQIVIPKEGLFMAFEFMNLKDNFEITYSDRIKHITPFICSSNSSTKTYLFERGKWILEETENYLPEIKISITQEEN